MSDIEQKIQKFSRLLAKVHGSDCVSESSAIDNIRMILNEGITEIYPQHHNQSDAQVPGREHRRDWIHDPSFLNNIPTMLRNQLTVALAYAEGQAECGCNGTQVSGCNCCEFPQAPCDFERDLDNLSADELHRFLDATSYLDDYPYDEYEDDDDCPHDEYDVDYYDESCTEDGFNFVMEQYTDLDEYKKCLDESGMFSVGKFRELDPAERLKMARIFRRVARSGKAKMTRERNKRRRVLDPVVLLKRARIAAKRVLERKYMASYDTASNTTKNQFNKMIHTAKMGEFIKTTKQEFKKIRNHELSKSISNEE